MQMPVNHQTLLGDFTGDFQVRDHEDESELHHARMADSGSGEGSGDAGSPVSSRGNGGCIRERPVKVIPCPRCQSMNTKFCYYNNYSVNQPRHFCRNCQRYWTVGGTLRNVPVGGGSRKKTRTRSRSDAHPYGASPDGASPTSSDVLLNASSCMQQLSMLPPTLGGFGANVFAPAGGQLPFLQFALEQGGMHPHKAPLAGLQEVPDLQSLYDAPQVPQLVNFSPMLNQSNAGFFLPEFAGGSSDALTSAMVKAGLWSSAPVPAQLPPMSSTPVPSSSWEPKTNSSTSLLQQLNGSTPGAFIDDRKMSNATVLPQSWASKHAAAWDTSLLQPPSSRPMMHHDRLVPQYNTLWDQNVSPNGSNITTSDEDRHLPSNCFGGYHVSDVVSQPWMGMQGSDILFQ